MISPAAILIKKGTLLPAPLELRNDSAGWACVAHNGDLPELEKALAATGWTFFYMAGAIRRAAFGLPHQTAMNAAPRRLVADVESQDAIAWGLTTSRRTRSGAFPTRGSRVISRHIQKGMIFSG